MKASATLLLLFLFSFAQAQYAVDWSKAPLNPIPEKYTLNHFKLKGKVTSIKEVTGNTITVFNNQGKAVSQTNEFDLILWIYDTSGHLIQQKWGDAKPLIINYKTNRKGMIVSIIHDEGTVQTVNYDKKGLYVSKMEGDVPVVKYSYDEKGRVVQEEYFYRGEPSMLGIYQYTETPAGLSIVTTHINRDTNETKVFTQNFNKSGDVVFVNNKEREYLYDSHGNILETMGNDYPIRFEYVYADDKGRK